MESNYTSMKKITLISFAFLGLFISCNTKEQSSNQESEAKHLEQLANEIKSLAYSKSCTDPNQWSFVSIGSKPCGGPWMFMPYPTTIDVDAFLELVAVHKAKEHEYNITWGMASDCSIPPTPIGVNCINGKPELDY